MQRKYVTPKPREPREVKDQRGLVLVRIRDSPQKFGYQDYTKNISQDIFNPSNTHSSNFFSGGSGGDVMKETFGSGKLGSNIPIKADHHRTIDNRSR